MSYDCYCDDGEPAEFYHQATHKARALHKCTECGRAVQPGEQYEKVFAKWDGFVDTLKTCQRCVAIREHLKAHVRCFCWMHHSLLDDVRAEVEHLPSEAYGSGLLFELGRMAVAIRRAPTVASLRGAA